MKFHWFFLAIALVASLAGFFLSEKLLSKHMHFGPTPEWMSALCESGEEGGRSCDAVLSSRWGMFPPLPADGSDDGRGRLPVALIGMGYFSAMLVWFLAVGRANHEGRFWHLLPLGINAVAFAGSVGFMAVMGTELKTWCPLCVMTHAANGVMLICNALLWPRKKKTQTDAAPEVPTVAVRYPTGRLAIVAILLGLGIAQLELQMVSVKALKITNAKLSAVVEKIQGSVQALVSMHMAGNVKNINVRPDDPIRHAAHKVPTLVVFSDFECSACRKFAADFEDKFYEAFGRIVQVAYKHYPLCSDCNPHTRRRTHPQACRIARLAEAVRIVGGNEKFWEAHDWFFDNQKTLAKIGAVEAGEHLGLDAERLAEVMESEEVSQRIAEDIALAHELGVRSTPSVYLNNRAVESWARGVEGFWKGLGSMYKISRAKMLAAEQARRSSRAHEAESD